jgi:branched-chain amino acid transport system substrate-binding protein
MKLKRLLVATAGLSTAALLASACGTNLSSGSSDPGSTTGPVTVGVLVDQTAYLKSADEKVLAGFQAAVKQINANGGVLNGRKLKLVVEDTAADPQKEVQAYQRVTSQDQPVAFLNGFSSAGNAAVAPIAKRDKIPSIVASVLPAEGSEWMFSTITPMKYETGTRVEYLKKQGIDKVAILHDPTPYNKLQLDTIEGQLKDAGITVTGVEDHAPDAVDLRPQVAKLLAKNPGAIIKLSTGPTQIVAAKALADAGSTVPFLLGIETRPNINQATAAYPQTLIVSAPLQVYDNLSANQKNQAMSTFLDANPNADDPTYVGRGWDAVHLYAQAVQKAGSTEGGKVRKALEDMGPYDATSGSYDYTASDHYGITSNPDYLAKITADSTKIVFTPAR